MASERRQKELPRCWTEPVLDGSKTDPLLDKAKYFIFVTITLDSESHSYSQYMVYPSLLFSC